MGAQTQKTTVSEAKAQAASAFSTYFKTLVQSFLSPPVFLVGILVKFTKVVLLDFG